MMKRHLLALLVLGVLLAMVGCDMDKKDFTEQAQAAEQARQRSLVTEQMKVGQDAASDERWGEAAKAAQKVLEVDPNHAGAQELKRRAFWGPLPVKTLGNLKYKTHPTELTYAIVGLVDEDTPTPILATQIAGLTVVRIGNRAFYYCRALTSVTIGSSVKSIGDGAFSVCSKLAAFSVAAANPSYQADDGVLFTKGAATLVRYPQGKPGETYTIPSSVTSIGDRAFWGCEALTSMTIPSSVTNIGDRAFRGCGSLKSVTIPSSVTSIGDKAFFFCDDLKSVTIPSSVTSIGDEAFAGCDALTSVTIPSSVTSIGNEAFWGCRALTSVTIPSSVTSIGDNAFWGCRALKSVTIPSSVTSIGNGAFSGCRALTSVTLPKGVKLGDGAFEGCPWTPPNR